MDRGSYNRLITVQRLDPAAGQDAGGQPVPAWIDFVKPWANIAGKTGLSHLESVVGNTPVSVTRFSIRIPYRTDIDAGMRVVHGADIYDITAVLPDKAQREHTDLVCELGANHG